MRDDEPAQDPGPPPPPPLICTPELEAVFPDRPEGQEAGPPDTVAQLYAEAHRRQCSPNPHEPGAEGDLAELCYLSPTGPPLTPGELAALDWAEQDEGQAIFLAALVDALGDPRDDLDPDLAEGEAELAALAQDLTVARLHAVPGPGPDQPGPLDDQDAVLWILEEHDQEARDQL